MSEIIRPLPLSEGDLVAIVTPAAPVNPDFVEGACERIERDYGLRAVIMPHALDTPDGVFASTLENRLQDFTDAWENPEIKAILCSRGGYGSVQLVPGLYGSLSRNVPDSPKWVVGFSDITVFHSLLTRLGIASIHGPMAKNIATTPNESVKALFDILMKDSRPEYVIPSHPYNIPGEVTGLLTGGNFATLNGLASTFIDPLDMGRLPGRILFVEDVGENIYEINRMLYRLGVAGTLSGLAGMVIGQFTAYKPDRSFQTMEEMIRDTLARFDVRCPVVFNFPSGHVDNNMPLVMGGMVRLSVNEKESRLRML